MAFTKQELERYADDVYKDRRISTSIYCGNCGYNLRTLPYLYRCPECGQEYNARPLSQKGIYAPQNTDIPFGDFAAAGFCALAVYICARGAFNPLDIIRILFALTFFVFTGIFLSRTYDKFMALLKARRVAKRIAMEEE